MKQEDDIDIYTFKDNIRRLCLYDMLRRKPYLKNITLEELEGLVQSINTLVSNLEYHFKEGIPKINVRDESNWSSSSLFRDVFLHNVLDIPIECEGTTKDFKEMLRNRWRKEDEINKIE